MFGKVSDDSLSDLASTLNDGLLPFIRKDKVLELFTAFSKEWEEKAMAVINKEKEDLDNGCRKVKNDLYCEREECFSTVREFVKEYADTVVECSKIAFCFNECGKEKMNKCSGSCRKRDLYVQSLLQGCKSVLSEDFEPMLTEKQRKIWKEIIKEK